MKAIVRKKDTTLFLKIFESKEFNCTIFVYFDIKNKVTSVNYHWGTADIQPKYMDFNGDGEITQLYKMFLNIMGVHSAKIYDLVIGAHSLNSPKDLKIGRLESEIAEHELRIKTVTTKLDKVTKLLKEL